MIITGHMLGCMVVKEMDTVPIFMDLAAQQGNRAIK